MHNPEGLQLTRMHADQARLEEKLRPAPPSSLNPCTQGGK